MSDKHEWLNLIEVSGPFLALPVLHEAFPQGLEELASPCAKRIRNSYETWRDAVDTDDVGAERLHAAWVEDVLRTALEADEQLLRVGRDVPACVTELTEQEVTITPDFVFVDPSRSGAVILPIHVFPFETDLMGATKSDGLSWSPGDRMAVQLRALNVPFGLVTNGERWMLVHAPSGQVATFASWYARLWDQEPITLRAFASLLGVRRFFAPEQDRLPALFERSLKYQDDVTDALGDQVRRAIEVLLQALDRADQDRNRELLHDVEPQELYEAGLTLMMRLVFLLAAEERGLLLLGEPRYDAFYAVSTLRTQLRVESDEILERRHAAWSRLLAVFRAVFGGIEHPTLPLPAMGGSLFDPDRFPFLEGRGKGTSWRDRLAEPLPIDDRTVLHVLAALQTVTVRRAVDGQHGPSDTAEKRTLSYRALDVEQIGHVYEGLLERTVARVGDVTLELEGGEIPELARVTLGELESARLDGDIKLVELLSARSSKSAATIRRILAREHDALHSSRLLSICRGDVALRDALLPYARLVRTDVWGNLLVHLRGAFLVVLAANRRETGTHYTPKHVAQFVVEETLGPLVYHPTIPDVAPCGRVLKTSAEILNLRVCDPAMGSGAFLVQACRYLAARVAEAWMQERETTPPSSRGLARVGLGTLAGEAEVLAVHARQLVAERCLYGADLNPLAVELAKLSLWLVTFSKGRPFGFLDHHLHCGDALLGVGTLDELTELATHDDPDHGAPFASTLGRAIERAATKRHELELTPQRDLKDVQHMSSLDCEALAELEDAKCVADAVVGTLLEAKGKKAISAQLSELAIQTSQIISGDPEAKESLALKASDRLSLDTGDARPRNPLHWPLVFPEAATAGGFDAVLGNPPWVSYAGRAAQPLADSLRRYYSSRFESFAGYRNLQGLFIERVGAIARSGGRLGLVIPSSMAELSGYAPVREVHDRFAVCDPELPNLPENTFRKVNQPSMVLYSTVRVARLDKGRKEPWPMARPDLDEMALALLRKLDRPSLPASLFGERGLQTSGEDTDHLANEPDEVHDVPLRVGGDIRAFCLGPPSQYADSRWFGDRLREPSEWKAVDVLIRQTARVPTAVRSDGLGFRNSLLAGFGSQEYPPNFLVAYLNSTPIRWRHYFLNRDARLGMPQMKVGALRGIPAPPIEVVSRVDALGRRFSSKNEEIGEEEQLMIDQAVALAFGIAEDELLRMTKDSVRWSVKRDDASPRQVPQKAVKRRDFR